VQHRQHTDTTFGKLPRNRQRAMLVRQIKVIGRFIQQQVTRRFAFPDLRQYPR
jgi:hypothetical protein